MNFYLSKKFSSRLHIAKLNESVLWIVNLFFREGIQTSYWNKLFFMESVHFDLQPFKAQ